MWLYNKLIAKVITESIINYIVEYTQLVAMVAGLSNYHNTVSRNIFEIHSFSKTIYIKNVATFKISGAQSFLGYLLNAHKNIQILCEN